MDVGPSPGADLRSVIRNLKELLRADRDLGFDPPPVSPSSRVFAAGTGEGKGPDNETAGVRTLEELRAVLGECRRCRLSEERTHLVFGEGDPRASLVFVGEGPGRDEDRVGRPFVGESGRLLTRIIEAMGLTRDRVYICNVVKCHPPKNRDPREDEVGACIPFLRRQLDLIEPAVICVLGRVAGRALLGADFSITRDRGRWFDYGGVRVMPVFHPAYLLRNPSTKRHAWEDVQKIMKLLEARGRGDA